MKKLILFLCAALALPALAQTTNSLSTHPPAGTVSDADLLYATQVISGTPTSVKMTVGQVKAHDQAGLVPQTTTINNHPLSANITLAAADLSLATVATSGSYTDLTNLPTLTGGAWGSITGTLSSQTDLQAALNAKLSLTGNGSGLTGLTWSQIGGAPTSLAGYGITDPVVLTSSTYSNPSWLASLAYSKLTGAPSLATVATSGSYTDLSSKPTIPAAQVNTDWNAVSGVAQVLNKPTLGSAAAQNTSAFDAAGAATTVQSLALLKTDNLASLTSASTARTNLGLGSAATSNTSAFDAAGTAAAAIVGLAPLNSAPFTGTPTLGGLPFASSVTTDATQAVNVKSSWGGVLRNEFNGPFLSGRERAVVWNSVDGVHWQNIPGINNYSPPVASGYNYAGVRNCSLIRRNGKWLFIYSPSYSTTGISGGTDPNYDDVATGNDLVNFTYATNTGTPTGFIGFNARWFTDPATNNLYVESFGNFLQSPTGDGLTWATSVFSPSLAAGGTFHSAYGSSEQYFTMVGSTYLAFVITAPSSGAFHVFSSSSFATGWVDLGAPTGWTYSSGLEGIAVWTGPDGVFHTADNLGRTSSSATPTVLSSWSAYGTDPLYTDGGGSYTYTDSDTKAVVAAALGADKIFYQQAPSSATSSAYICSTPVNFWQQNPAQTTGIGTIAVGSLTNDTATWTGTGTLFTLQCQVGSLVTTADGHGGLVRTIASNTSMVCTNYPNSTTTGQTFTILPPVATFASDGNNNGTDIWTFINGTGDLIFKGNVSGRGPYWLGSDGSQWFVTCNAGWALSNGFATTRTNVFQVDLTAPAGSLHLTSANIQTGVSLQTTAVGTTLSIKSGTNSKSGSFTLASGAATVANTSVTANSVIQLTVKTVSGTRAGNPDIVPTAGTGFTASGAATDNGTYNYWIEENN